MKPGDMIGRPKTMDEYEARVAAYGHDYAKCGWDLDGHDIACAVCDEWFDEVYMLADDPWSPSFAQCPVCGHRVAITVGSTVTVTPAIAEEAP